MADDTFDWKLDGSGFGQPNASSCWYAAYAMVHTWKGRPISSIRERIEKAKLDFNDYYQNGLPEEDFPKTLIALGMVGFRGGYAFSVIDDFEQMVHMLKGYGPLWCAFSKPGAHVVVISGVNASMKQIHILNPWNNTVGTDADDQYLTPAMFKSRLNSAADSVLQGFM